MQLLSEEGDWFRLVPRLIGTGYQQAYCGRFEPATHKIRLVFYWDGR
jgi:hypothetical protein